MGLFDSISKTVSSLVSKIKPAFDVKLPILSNLGPSTSLKSYSSAVVTAISGPTAISKAPTIAKSGVSLVKAAVQTAKPTTKLALLAASVPTAGLLVNSSKARKAVVTAPAELYNFGSNLGKVVDNPSLSTAKELFTENPLIAGGTAAAGGLLLGKGIFSAATSIASTQALQKNTEAISEKSLGSGIVDTIQQGQSNKYDLNLVQEQTKQLKLQLESQEKIAKMQIEAAEKSAKSLPTNSPTAAAVAEPPLVSSPAAAAPTIAKKKTTKKKKKKKATKKKKKTTKKKKKKAKTIKRKKPVKKKKPKKKAKKTKKRKKK